MKTLLTIVSALVLSLSAFSSELPGYYTAEFEIEKVAPLCPPPRVGGMACMAVGTRITLKATIGCADSLVFSDINHEIVDRGVVGLYVHSLVKQHKNSILIRCIKANEVRTEVIVPYNSGHHYNVINQAPQASF